MAKMKRVGLLAPNTTGKVGRLQAKNGQVFFGFQHKTEDSPIWISEELKDLIKMDDILKLEGEKKQLDAAKKALTPYIAKCKLGQMDDSDSLIAYLGGDFTWA